MLYHTLTKSVSDHLAISLYYKWRIIINIMIESIIIILFLGAQIIDLMILVIDVTKGIQTQTAEVCCNS